MMRYDIKGNATSLGLNPSPNPEGEWVKYADAQATVEAAISDRDKQQDISKALYQQVEALQRERDAVLEAASLPTWVCDGCGRVSSEGWINRVIDSFEGTDYEMECPVCGVRAIEEDCASDLVRERDDLQAALDAEREKVKGLEAEVELQETAVRCASHVLDKSRETHNRQAAKIREQQEQLSQLQALVRAISETMEPFRKSLAKLDEVDTLATRRIAEADAYYCAQRVLATLDALTPAAKGGDGE